MFVTTADLAQAERLLEQTQPLHTEQRGVALDFCTAIDPNQPALQVAYRTYQPADLSEQAAVLFIHDAWQSGLIYDEAALALAERGIFASALSLGWHGSGRWYSRDPWSQEQMTVERYLHHVCLVAEALTVERRHSILVGGGVLGSLIAQQYVRDRTLAGIVLLGGCLPHLAAVTWRVEGVRRPWWQRKQAPASPALVPPPDQDRIRERWLGYVGVSDAEVFAVWQYLCAESPLVQQAYAALENQPPYAPPVPALVLAGEHDAVLRREALEMTASTYGVQLALIPGAPHFLVRSAQRLEVVDRLADFCREVSGQPSASVPKREQA